jgi:hypothetical protein
MGARKRNATICTIKASSHRDLDDSSMSARKQLVFFVIIIARPLEKDKVNVDISWF